MPPKFSLQNVLDVRHSRVEAFELELSRLLHNQSELERQLASLIHLMGVLTEKFTQVLEGDIDLFAVDHLRSDIQEVNKLTVQTEAEVEKAKKMVVEKRQQLVTAKQAEEVLDILKNKMIETYNGEQALKEARNQDDIYIARAFREQTQGV